MTALRGKYAGLLDNAYHYRKNRFDVEAELDQLVDRRASVIHIIGQLLGRLSGTRDIIGFQAGADRFGDGARRIARDIPGTERNLLHGGSQQI